MRTLIELKSATIELCKKKVMHNVNLKIREGQISTLIGKNGIGKTALIKAILEKKNNQGRIFIDPKIKFGYVPQKINSTFNIPIKVKLLLNILSLQYRNMFNIEEFIRYTKIKNKDISSISGGELQKIILSGTIMNTPDILILDEPTQYLDFKSQKKLYKILDIFKKKLGVSVLMTSHDLFSVIKYSDQIIFLNEQKCYSIETINI